MNHHRHHNQHFTPHTTSAIGLGLQPPRHSGTILPYYTRRVVAYLGWVYVPTIPIFTLKVDSTDIDSILHLLQIGSSLLQNIRKICSKNDGAESHF